MINSHKFHLESYGLFMVVLPQENKAQSNQSAIKDAGIPPYLVIAIEYKGYTPELLVKVGDPVLNKR